MRKILLEHIIKQFGYVFTATYEEVAEKVGFGISFSTIRRFFMDMEKAGVLTIVKQHYRLRSYHFDKDKVNHIIKTKRL